MFLLSIVNLHLPFCDVAFILAAWSGDVVCQVCHQFSEFSFNFKLAECDVIGALLL